MNDCLFSSAIYRNFPSNLCCTITTYHDFSWSPKTTNVIFFFLHQIRFGHTATSLSADMVLLVGGFGPHNKKHTRLDGAQLLYFVQGKNSSRWKKALNEIASSRFESFSTLILTISKRFQALFQNSLPIHYFRICCR